MDLPSAQRSTNNTLFGFHGSVASKASTTVQEPNITNDENDDDNPCPLFFSGRIPRPALLLRPPSKHTYVRARLALRVALSKYAPTTPGATLFGKIKLKVSQFDRLRGGHSGRSCGNK